MVDDLKRLMQRSIFTASASGFRSAAASLCLTFKHFRALFSQFPIGTEEVSSAFATSKIDALTAVFNDTLSGGLVLWATKKA
jgi:hypothetical protein